VLVEQAEQAGLFLYPDGQHLFAAATAPLYGTALPLG
jgi:hypothetical protein